MYKIGTGIGVIILKEGKILLGLRNDDPEKADTELHLEGTWTMPGGKIEYGETFEQAAIREVKEETNMDVMEVRPFCVQTDKNQYAHFVTVGLIAEKYQGEPKVMEPDEIVCWKWFALDHLPEKMYFPSKKAIQNYKNHTFYTKDEQ